MLMRQSSTPQLRGHVDNEYVRKRAAADAGVDDTGERLTKYDPAFFGRRFRYGSVSEQRRVGGLVGDGTSTYYLVTGDTHSVFHGNVFEAIAAKAERHA